VDLIRSYSNKTHLKLRYADLRKQLQQAEPRLPEPPNIGRTRSRKRRLTKTEIDQIIAKYQSGASTNQLMREHHLAKSTISALLRARGAKLRHQGLTDEQAREAATYYAVGRSLAWIAHHFGGISPTTVARALRRRGTVLRPRPGSI
jgi:hypothetical protein